MTHKRKTKPSLRVQVIARGVFRLGETKRACVIYTDANGTHHVRTVAEFNAMFDPV